MATSAVTASTTGNAAYANTANTAAASNRANAQKILTSLSAGSGVDVNSLAQNLVDAERAPRENAINSKITKNESRISGYSAISFMMSELNKSISALKDKSSFNALVPNLSSTANFNVTTTVNAVADAYNIEVEQLAKAQRNLSSGYAETQKINNGAAFALTFRVAGAGKVVNIAAGKDTPAEVVAAINAAQTGITARLVNTGSAVNPYKIMLTGPLGADNAWAVSTTAAAGALDFSDQLQSAQDASVKVDGVRYTRPTNSLTDVITGLTLDLKSPNVAGATTNLSLSRDTTALKNKLNAVVTAYNDANNILKEVSDPKSTLDTYGATLVGDSTVRSVRQQMRDMVLGSSSTASNGISSLWQLGLSIDQTGTMSADSAKMDAALTDQFDDVVQSLTGGKDGFLATGLFGDASKKLTALVSTKGLLATQSQDVTTQNTRYKEDLTKLQTRMDSLLQRYVKQFASMDSLVGQVNSQKTSLKSSFDGMMSVYTKN